jgi:hypothetical protein
MEKPSGAREKPSAAGKKLDEGKLRAMHLAGTVAFPLSFAMTGSIWFEKRTLEYHSTTRHVDLVYVYEKDMHDQESTRFVLSEHVEAIFFPGSKEGRGGSATYRFADAASDLEKGVWFLGPDVNAKTIKEVLKIDVYQRDSGAKGIIYVPEIRAVYSMDEWAQTASEVSYTRGCDPRYP